MNEPTDSELQDMARRSQDRAGLTGVVRAPMPPLDVKAFMASLPPPGVDTGEFERSQRTAEALAIRGMLPPFLRSGTRPEMVARITERDFLEAVQGWRWGQGNLLLLGPTGTGKSTACAILFRALLAHGVRHGGEAWENARLMAWYRADDLADARREHALGKGEAPELGRAARARLLVLDDAGWDRDPLACSSVLAERYEAGRPTILTSGKTEEELVAHYGAAVVRRILETGGSAPAGGGIMARFPRSA